MSLSDALPRRAIDGLPARRWPAFAAGLFAGILVGIGISYAAIQAAGSYRQEQAELQIVHQINQVRFGMTAAQVDERIAGIQKSANVTHAEAVTMALAFSTGGKGSVAAAPAN